MLLSHALALFEFNGDGLALLVLGPAIVGIAALIGSIGFFVGAQQENLSKGARIGLHVFAVILLILALGIGACFGIVLS